MAPTAMKLRADFELTCFTYEGIDAIREALLCGKAVVDNKQILEKKGTDKEGDKFIQATFKLIAPPHYRCETVTLKKVEGLAVLDEALHEIERVIREKGGAFKIVNKPQIIGDSAKDKDLEDIMKMPGERDSDNEDGGSSGVEDNDEGMGDLDVEGLEDEEGAEAGEDQEEERKTTTKSKSSKGKKKAKGDDSDEDEDA